MANDKVVVVRFDWRVVSCDVDGKSSERDTVGRSVDALVSRDVDADARIELCIRTLHFWI